MFHDDLSLYTSKEFRSSFYIENCWNLIEEKLIFYIGIFKNPQIDIYIYCDIVHIIIMNNNKVYYQEKVKKNFSHSLNLCEDFLVSISLKNSTKYEKINKKDTCIYIFAHDTDDEGLVDFFGSYNLNVKDYISVKEDIFLKLCLEIQYAIVRNIFKYNLKHKLKHADIDSNYEMIFFYSKINNISFEDSLNQLLLKNKINNKDYIYLYDLNKKLGEL